MHEDIVKGTNIGRVHTELRVENNFKSIKELIKEEHKLCKKARNLREELEMAYNYDTDETVDELLTDLNDCVEEINRTRCMIATSLSRPLVGLPKDDFIELMEKKKNNG